LIGPDPVAPQPMPQRLGVLGGTFNPPHLGHIAVASRALAQLHLERVLLMPSHTPPHKLPQHDPGPAHRLRMCQLAVAGHRGLGACALEIERGGPSYTVDTLLALHDRARADAHHPALRLTLILGSDMACTLPSWRRPDELVDLAGIAVAERPGDGRGEVVRALASLRPAALASAAHSPPRLAFLEMPAIDSSSSMVRERVARGEPVEELVGRAVAAYIAEHRLYGHQSSPTSGAPAR
jgi:nicotinate-nucleotide adenylyltransferase